MTAETFQNILTYVTKTRDSSVLRHLINMKERIFFLGYNNEWRHRLDPYAY